MVECHTHFPPPDYGGPGVDRLRILEDTDRDGRADRIRTFWEGSHATMSLRRGPAPWIYVATRMEIFRIADLDHDDVAETIEHLVELKTPGNYPHNGLCGLAFDSMGYLYFGLGENLGEPYTLVARDGTQRTGQGEGGNIYRVTREGRQLEQIATGFWNPFGIHVDEYGRIWAVDNDPDASPPCRLHRVLPGGDYGYQFRYGRTGRHPLQAWNGQLPGTLPMVAGTGEAPCAVLPLAGRLWVTSWGDNRIETYRLIPHGAWFGAHRQIVVQGDHQFRPVDFALSPSGELFITDWVDKSYPVHGRGRIWRVVFTEPHPFQDALAGNSVSDHLPPPTPEESRAMQWLKAAEQGQPLNETEFVDAIRSADVGLRQAAVWSDLVQFNDIPPWEENVPKEWKIARLQQARWMSLHGKEPSSMWLRAALADPDTDVRLGAVRLVAELGRKELRPMLEAMLLDPRLSPELFQALLATFEWLDEQKVSLKGEPSYQEYGLRALRESSTSDELRAMALRLLDPNEPRLDSRQLERWAYSSHALLRREAIRTLALRSIGNPTKILIRLAQEENRDVQERADAIMGLEGRSKAFVGTLRQWAQWADNPPLADAARRALGSPNAPSALADAPSEQQLDELLERLPHSGDANRGWRLFFGHHGVRCSACHRLGGRGASLGPDLTGIASRLSRKQLVLSIADPAREVAPAYTPWIITLENGQIFTGISLPSTESNEERFLLADGAITAVPVEQISERRAAPGSLMPTGYYHILTLQDWSDLLALLEALP